MSVIVGPSTCAVWLENPPLNVGVHFVWLTTNESLKPPHSPFLSTKSSQRIGCLTPCPLGMNSASKRNAPPGISRLSRAKPADEWTLVGSAALSPLPERRASLRRLPPAGAPLAKSQTISSPLASARENAVSASIPGTGGLSTPHPPVAPGVQPARTGMPATMNPQSAAAVIDAARVPL